MRAAALALLLVSLAAPVANASNEPLGWRERAVLRLDGDWPLEAKLDTGAEGSSLHARGLKRFVRDGAAWVRFHLSGQTQVIERPVLREVRVRRSRDGELRPKIAAKLCIAGRELDAELSLADRRGFEGTLLIGRDLLAQLGPVDAGRQYLQSPDCPP